MRAGRIFELMLEKRFYEPDGTMRSEFREHLTNKGYTKEEIELFERHKKHEIEMRKLISCLVFK